MLDILAVGLSSQNETIIRNSRYSQLQKHLLI